jgi:hypothetical protein
MELRLLDCQTERNLLAFDFVVKVERFSGQAVVS